MATKIEEYAKLKREMADATEWLGLIGKPYSGGGGGVGKLKPADIQVSVEVYHQEYNGANNYHKIPNALRDELKCMLAEQMLTLVWAARNRLEAHLSQLRAEAQLEYRKMMNEAGVEVDNGS